MRIAIAVSGLAHWRGAIAELQLESMHSRQRSISRPANAIRADGHEPSVVEAIGNRGPLSDQGCGLEWISCHRVLWYNNSASRSKPWLLACEGLGLTPIRTRPYTPRTNGKAERFIKTLLSEWAYVMSFQSSAERNFWWERYLGIYNRRRRQMA